MNAEAFRKTAAHIRALNDDRLYDQRIVIERRACGTAGCVAYHTLVSHGLPVSFYKWHTAARQVLDISKDDAQRLFSSEPARIFAEAPTGRPVAFWPEPFCNRWAAIEAKLSKERPADVAADLLEALADGRASLSIFELPEAQA